MQKISRGVIFFCLLICVHFPGLATGKPLLTVSDAMSAALGQSTQLQAAGVNLQYAKYVKNHSYEAYLPKIEIGGNLSTSGSLIDGQFNGILISGGARLGLGFSLSGDSLTRSKAMSSNLQRAELSFQQAYDDLSSQVMSAYWSVALAESQNRRVKDYRDVVAGYSGKEAVKNGTSRERLEAKWSLAQADERFEHSSYRALQVKSRFGAVTGLVPSEYIFSSLPDIVPLDLPDAEVLCSDFSHGNLNLDVQIKQNELTYYTIREKSYKLDKYVPQVNISAGWGFAGNSRHFAPDYYRNGFSDSWSASVSVNVPLSAYLPGSWNDRSVKQADVDVQNALIRKEQTKASLVQAVDQAVLTVKHLQSLYMIQVGALGTVTSLYLEVSRDFNDGKVSIKDLHDIGTGLLDLENSLDDIRMQHLLACHDLARLLGTDIAGLRKLYI